MPHRRGGLSLSCVPPSSRLAWGSSDPGESPQRQWVHIGGLAEGRSGGLLSLRGGTLTQSSDSVT